VAPLLVNVVVFVAKSVDTHGLSYACAELAASNAESVARSRY
jgi:hypothetical protein